MRLILLFLNLCLTVSFHNVILSKIKISILCHTIGDSTTKMSSTTEENENVYLVGFSNDDSTSSKDLEVNTVVDEKKDEELVSILVSNNLKRMRKENGGFDHRDIGKTCLEKIYDQLQERNTLNKLRKYNYQMNLLKKLQNMNVNEFEKIRAIDEYNYLMESSKYVANIESGGLYKNWNNSDC